MRMIVIKFNRPLMLITDENEGVNHFQPIYGFALKTLCTPYESDIEDYVCFLAAMHYGENGGDGFTVSYDRDPKYPDWISKKGVVHRITDDWAIRVGHKCREKIGLTYEIITAEVDDDIYELRDDDDFITDEWFFKKLTVVEETELA